MTEVAVGGDEDMEQLDEIDRAVRTNRRRLSIVGTAVQVAEPSRNPVSVDEKEEEEEKEETTKEELMDGKAPDDSKKDN